MGKQGCCLALSAEATTVLRQKFGWDKQNFVILSH